jgi:hypothetical protein
MKKGLLILCLTLTGCSGLSGMATDAALGAVGLGSDKGGLSVDTEIVAGDKEQEVQLGDTLEVAPKFDDVDLENSTLNVNTDTTQKQREINAEVLEYKEGVPYWQASVGAVVFLLLGLFMPQLVIRKK